jgi:hypothetical protein
MVVKKIVMESRNVYPIFILLFGCQVSGVSVRPSRRSKKRTVKSKKKLNEASYEDMQLSLPFLTPET